MEIHTIKIHTSEYVTYSDVQKRICQIMGIEEKNFRSYHKLIGGEYKDLWHVWIWLHNERIQNDSLQELYLEENSEGYSDHFKESFIERFGSKFTWEEIEPFSQAYNHVLKELRELTKSDLINIKYSW